MLGVLETLTVLFLMIASYALGHTRGYDRGYRTNEEDVREYQEKYMGALDRIDRMVEERMFVAREMEENA